MGNNIKQLLCFGDSNTWGLNGETGMRLPWEQRWTGLLQKKLGEDAYHVIEEGLCGRTTVFEDPLRKGRRGTALLPILLETHAQVDGIVLMLGTNDCKSVYGALAEVIGKGIILLLNQINEYADKAKVLLVSPIHLGEKVFHEGYDGEFSKQSVALSRNLDQVYEGIAAERNLSFMKASAYVSCCDADQEHMDAHGHGVFAEAVYTIIRDW